MSQQTEIEKRFVEWNVTGKGSDRLTLGNWAFRKEVLLYQMSPYKRFVRDSLKLPLMIRQQTRVETNVISRPSQVNLDKIAYQVWTLPTIGVWSRYEGDMLSEPELHERMKMLFFAELRTYNDEVVKAFSGADLVKQKGVVMQHVNRMYTRHRNYSVTFKLKWAELPEMYRTEITEAIDLKIKRYHDPKSVEARERAHARKIAKQAFGL